MAKILLVDDNEISLMMTEMVLSEMHYDVTTATSGEKAIECLQQESYDLMLLDIVMDDMSGIETLAEIREIPEPRIMVWLQVLLMSRLFNLKESLRQTLLINLQSLLKHLLHMKLLNS